MEHYKIIDGVKKDKIRYTSYKKASLNANKFNSNTKNIGKRKVYTLKCEVCKGYHLGSQKTKITSLSINKRIVTIYTDLLSKVKYTIDLT